MDRTPSRRVVTRRALLTEATAAVAATSTGIALEPDLASGSDPRTEVRRHRGRPCFHVDGRPYTKPVFETYVPETRYFRQFAEAGADVFSFSANLGPGFGPPCWVGPDRWDFSAVDERARRVIEACPRGLIMPRIYLTAPDWWVEAHPEECQLLEDGKTRYRADIGLGRAGKAFPSLWSAGWRAETADALRRVLRHMQEAEYGDSLFGVMVTGLMTEEWYHWSIHTGQLSDYSPHAVAAFRSWLRRRYRTDEALRRAWGRPDVSLGTADPPTPDERRADREPRTFRDPSREMPVIDWYRFYNEAVPDAIGFFCGAAKRATGGRKVAGAFYCYMFEFGGDPEFGHNAMGRLLRSRNVDFVMVTSSYYDRALGRGADYARSSITSAALHGKLWYHDNDTVSFRYDAINASNSDRGAVARYRVELGVTENALETIQQYRRSAGFVLGNGVYQSFFDLHGGYFDDPDLMAEVQRLYALFDGSSDADQGSVAEILVVSDEASCDYAVFESSLLKQTLQPFQVRMAKLGAPHDSILVDDLDRADLRRYRLVIFLNCCHLTDTQRQLIRRTALRGGRTVLWCYATGVFRGHETSPRLMSDLTGLRLARPERPRRVRARIALTQAGADLLANTDAGTVIGHEHIWAEPIIVDDPDAVVLGTLDGVDGSAFAMRRMPDWTSIYTMNPVLPSAALRAVARASGVHITNDRDDTLYASRSWLCINADGAGERVLRFAQPTDVSDPFGGRILARGIRAYRRHMDDRETLLLRLARSTDRAQNKEN